jgi:Carboxypeptidase regulatory-like domain
MAVSVVAEGGLMNRSSRLVGLLIPLVVSLAGVALWGTTQNAVIEGSVFAKGGPSAGASVHLINFTTGFSQEKNTDSQGRYTFVNVPPSEFYQIEVSKSGFKTQIRQGIRVEVGAYKIELPPFILDSPPRPTVEGPSLELINTTLGGVIDSSAIRTLPLANRDFIDLTLLVPGAYPVEQGSVLEGASLVVNGARADMNNFLLDGADDNDYTINQSLPFQIVEGLQEFRVQASTSPADFGRSGGAQINSVTRRGLNKVHGTVFEFLRNSALGADNFFSAYSGGTFDEYARNVKLQGKGDPLGNSTLAALFNNRKPFVNQNQFGANIGGPLRKDTLFGFFNWESFRISNPRPIFEQVPGLNVRSATTCTSAFPPAPCDPIALKLFNLYPAPNVPTVPGTPAIGDFSAPDSGPAFFVGESANSTTTDNFLGRVDWQASDRASMSFKYNIQRINQTQGGTVPQTSNYPGNGAEVSGRNQNFTYNYLYQVSSHTSNELRLGWNRFRLGALPLDRGVDPASLGFQNLDLTNQGLPTVVIGGFSTTLGPLATIGANSASPSSRANEVWSAADNISYSRGQHDWKFGAELRYARLNIIDDALGRGVLDFRSANQVAGGIAGEIPPGEYDSGSIARVSSAFGGGFDRYFRSHSFDGFLQDHWRPLSNLSISYGVRYEMNTAPVEIRNRLVNYYPNLGGLVQGGGSTIYDPFAADPPLGKAPNPVPRAGFNTDYNNWGPRLGLAWDPRKDGKTVLRAGYALMYDQESFQPSVNMLYNGPFVQQDFTELGLGATLEDTFSVCGTKALAPGDLACLSQNTNPNSSSQWLAFPYSVTALDPGDRTTYVHQFHLGIERQLGSQAVFETDYVGSLGHKLPQLREVNMCTYQTLIASLCDNPSAGVPAIDFVSILNQQNSANSNFNSLQVGVRTRALKRLQVEAHYAWAKSIDNSSSLQPQVFLFNPVVANFLASAFGLLPDAFAGANNISPALSLEPTLPLITTRPRLPQDGSNLRAERGLSDFDIRHRFVINYIYALPRWTAVGPLGKGWEVAGITTLESGQPYTVFYDAFGIPLRPDLVGRVSTNDSNPNAAINGGLPLLAPGSPFVPVVDSNGSLAPGSLGRNTFEGPRLINFDFSILKDTYVGTGETKRFQFRAEFFNLFNNVNFRQPFSDAGTGLNGSATSKPSLIQNPFFGQILQARPAREIQFALKFIF